MFVMMNRMTVPDNYRDKFESYLQTRAKAVDRRPGFIRAEILKPNRGNEYIIMTHWQTEEDFDGWNGSETS